jgi:hypothetical protein
MMDADTMGTAAAVVASGLALVWFAQTAWERGRRAGHQEAAAALHELKPGDRVRLRVVRKAGP